MASVVDRLLKAGISESKLREGDFNERTKAALAAGFVANLDDPTEVGLALQKVDKLAPDLKKATDRKKTIEFTFMQARMDPKGVARNDAEALKVARRSGLLKDQSEAEAIREVRSHLQDFERIHAATIGVEQQRRDAIAARLTKAREEALEKAKKLDAKWNAEAGEKERRAIIRGVRHLAFGTPPGKAANLGPMAQFINRHVDELGQSIAGRNPSVAQGAKLLQAKWKEESGETVELGYFEGVLSTKVGQASLIELARNKPKQVVDGSAQVPRPWSGREDADRRAEANRGNNRRDAAVAKEAWYSRFFRRGRKAGRANARQVAQEAAAEEKRADMADDVEAGRAEKEARQQKRNELRRLGTQSKKAFEQGTLGDARWLAAKALPYGLVAAAVALIGVAVALQQPFYGVAGASLGAIGGVMLAAPQFGAKSWETFTVAGAGLAGEVRNIWGDPKLVKGLPFLGRMFVRFPGGLWGLAIVWLGMGFAAAMTLVADGGLQDNSIANYPFYALGAAIAALINMVLLAINAIVWGLVAVFKIAFVGLVDIVEGLINAALKMLLTVVTQLVGVVQTIAGVVGIQVPSFNTDLAPNIPMESVIQGDVLHFNYFEPSQIGSCSNFVIQVVGCRPFVEWVSPGSLGESGIGALGTPGFSVDFSPLVLIGKVTDGAAQIGFHIMDAWRVATQCAPSLFQGNPLACGEVAQ